MTDRKIALFTVYLLKYSWETKVVDNGLKYCIFTGLGEGPKSDSAKNTLPNIPIQCPFLAVMKT